MDRDVIDVAVSEREPGGGVLADPYGREFADGREQPDKVLLSDVGGEVPDVERNRTVLRGGGGGGGDRRIDGLHIVGEGSQSATRRDRKK